MINHEAERLLAKGELRIKVKRSGMLQYQIFKVRKVQFGSAFYVELFLDKNIELSEAIKVSNDIGLPVQTKTHKVFPTGKSAHDFII